MIHYKLWLILFFGLLYIVKTTVASEVFILAGQSNMRGRGEVTELLGTKPRLIKIPENVEFYWDGKICSLFGRRNLRWTFGPEASFAHEISKAWPDTKIVLIKYAVTGSSLLRWEEKYYKILIELVHAITKGKVVEYAGVLWMQGEADADSIEKSEQYFENLKALIERTRQDLPSSDCPFLLGWLSAFDKPGCEIIRHAQLKAAKDIPRTFLVSTKGLSTLKDNMHYDSKGQIELGRRFAGVILSLYPYSQHELPEQTQDYVLQ